MNEPSSVECVTVSYRREMPFLKLQARSIARYADPELFSRINVIVSEEDFDKFSNLFDNYVRPEYAHFAPRVRLLARRDISEAIPRGAHGWWAQQALKLGAFRAIETPHYLVLDSKNHLVRQVARVHLFDERARVRTWADDNRSDLFEKRLRASFSFVGLNSEHYRLETPPSITPIILDTRVVQDLEAFVQNRASQPLESIFFQGWEITEFLLYHAFQIKKAGNIHSILNFGPPNTVILFEDKLADLNRFGSIMFQAESRHVYSFAVHHLALPHLTSGHVDRIANLWLGRGLIGQAAEATEFLRLLD